MNNGGPAFPKPAFYAPGTVEDGLYNGPEDGMSVRTYLAGKALGGLMSNPGISPSMAAGISVAAADAVIEELRKEADL